MNRIILLKVCIKLQWKVTELSFFLLYFCAFFLSLLGFPSGSVVKNPHAKQEARVQSLGREDPQEEGMATHSSILAWRIPRTEEPSGLQPIASQRVRHDWSDLAHTHTSHFQCKEGESSTNIHDPVIPHFLISLLMLNTLHVYFSCLRHGFLFCYSLYFIYSPYFHIINIFCIWWLFGILSLLRFCFCECLFV